MTMLRFSSGNTSAMKGTIIVRIVQWVRNLELDNNVQMKNRKIKSSAENTKWLLATNKAVNEDHPTHFFPAISSR